MKIIDIVTEPISWSSKSLHPGFFVGRRAAASGRPMTQQAAIRYCLNDGSLTEMRNCDKEYFFGMAKIGTPVDVPFPVRR